MQAEKTLIAENERAKAPKPDAPSADAAIASLRSGFREEKNRKSRMGGPLRFVAEVTTACLIAAAALSVLITGKTTPASVLAALAAPFAAEEVSVDAESV